VRAAFRRCSRNVWRSASSVVLAILVTACGTAAAPGPSASATASTRTITFTNVAATSNSRQDGGTTLVVGTTDQRSELIRSLVPTLVAPVGGQALIAAFEGQQQTGGYSIAITRIDRDGDQVIVHATFVEPPAGSFVTEVLTSPAYVVSVSTTDLAGARIALLIDDAGTERARATLP